MPKVTFRVVLVSGGIGMICASLRMWSVIGFVLIKNTIIVEKNTHLRYFVDSLDAVHKWLWIQPNKQMRLWKPQK